MGLSFFNGTEFERALSIPWSLRLRYRSLPNRENNDVAGPAFGEQILQWKSSRAE
jgi:hypothetical protein